MGRKRYTVEQIIRKLREAEVSLVVVRGELQFSNPLFSSSVAPS